MLKKRYILGFMRKPVPINWDMFAVALSYSETDVPETSETESLFINDENKLSLLNSNKEIKILLEGSN